MFTLANPSEDKTNLISQIDRLLVITEGNCSFDADMKSQGSCLTVDENFITSGRKLPLKLRGKVKINPQTGLPATLNERTIIELLKILPDEDEPVLTAYVDKYSLNNDSTFVTVIDSNSSFHVNPQVLLIMARSAMDHQNLQSMTLTVIRTGSGKKPIIFGKEFVDNNIHVNETPNLDWGTAVRMAISCKNHILMRNKVGSLCAKISPCQVYSPVPLIDNTQPKLGWVGVQIPLESTPFFDRVYYINLDHRTDRRANMEEQLNKFNLASARIVGVNGKDLQWNPNLGIVSKFWNQGALGYCLSYQNAIIDALKNGYERILVMDDDAVLSDNFLTVLGKAFQNLPDDWHMLYLAANHSKESMPMEKDRISDNVYRLKGSLGSHAIIINRVAFETILNFASSPYGPLDIFFSVYQQICPCYITYPGLATQMSGKSDIINENVNYSKDWGIDYINHIEYLKTDAK